MDWLEQLFMGSGVAHSILLIALTIALGIVLGKIKIFGVSLGGTCILFVGILFAELGMQVHLEVLHFFKEFGLILFVFSIGLQVGSSFFSNFKKGGGAMNLLAVLVVVLGVATTLAIYYLSPVPIETMVGIMSGAITNTPGLGAAQQAYRDITGTTAPTIAMGYAVAYPLGVVGIIVTLVLLRVVGRVDMRKEERRILSESEEAEDATLPVVLTVQNPSIFGTTLQALGTTIGQERHFVVSRIIKVGENAVQEVSSDTLLEEGDKLFVVTEKQDVEALVLLIGEQQEVDNRVWMPKNVPFVSKKIVVSQKRVCGKRIKELNLRKLYGVNITRITRSGIDIVATPDLMLQYGDKLTVVGAEKSIQKAGEVMGNSYRHLKEPNLFTIFIGIVMGIVVGSIPFQIPGIPQPVKLGLAGGPLIVAILIASFGHRFRLVPYTTTSANFMLREIGISSFLACVGLGTAGTFVNTLVNEGGFVWVGYGVIITMLPLIIVGLLGLFVFKLDYFTLTGVISGSCTNPPALSFSNAQTVLDRPAVSYATVYPLTMFLRVLAAQLLIIFFL